MGRVSYRDDFLISYRVYMMTWSFHIEFIWRYTSCWWNTRAIQNGKHYACATHSSLPADRLHTDGEWSFRVYMIPYQNFVPEWNSHSGTATVVNSPRCDLRRHDILWWYHVSKYRVTRRNRIELEPARKSPQCHDNTPLEGFYVEKSGQASKIIVTCGNRQRKRLLLDGNCLLWSSVYINNL